MKAAQYNLDFEHTKSTPYLALKGDLWGVFSEDFVYTLHYKWHCTVFINNKCM